MQKMIAQPCERCNCGCMRNEYKTVVGTVLTCLESRTMSTYIYRYEWTAGFVEHQLESGKAREQPRVDQEDAGGRK